MAVFAGHQGLVSSGVVCVLPGMAPMSGAATVSAGSTDAGSMQSMPGMRDRAEPLAPSDQQTPSPDDQAPADHAPCTDPPSGQCLAAMPCATAIGSHLGETSLPALALRDGEVVTLTVLMPASATPAPELPPPRA